MLWIRDSDGRWHATDHAGVSPWGDTGVTIVSMRLIPPLDHGITWIQIAATGPIGSGPGHPAAQLPATITLGNGQGSFAPSGTGS